MANYRAQPLPPVLQGLPQNVVGNMLHGWFVSRASKNILVYKTEKPDGAGPRHSHLTTFWIDLNFTGGTKVGSVRIGATAHGKSSKRARIQASFRNSNARTAFEMLTQALHEMAVLPEQTSESIQPQLKYSCPKLDQIVLGKNVVAYCYDPYTKRNWFCDIKTGSNLGFIDADVKRCEDLSGDEWFNFPMRGLAIRARDVEGYKHPCPELNRIILGENVVAGYYDPYIKRSWLCDIETGNNLGFIGTDVIHYKHSSGSDWFDIQKKMAVWADDVKGYERYEDD
jgi:hypothetical protein